ncbi:hypothetical protein GCM10023200_13290 [Actinomycetospora chlora]|uniref:Uncharacterized protein n=1 Tax=Actinomycetospora chlora TaxID=663608 RepID=A0ABP9AJ30_9PSEU
MSALDRLDAESAKTIREVLGQRAPDLLRAVESSDTPTMSLREQVNDVLADEIASELTGPEWEPTPYGARVENAVERFLVAYQITRGVRGTEAWPPDPDLRGPGRAGQP